MSRESVLRLKQATHGDALMSSHDIIREQQSNHGALTAQYTRAYTVCWAVGDLYLVYFDSRNRMTSWRVEPSGGAC
jgi:hypothetical protein